MRVLVTGGAGYIGSVVVEELLRAGHETFVLDNLSKGFRQAVHPEAKLFVGDLLDTEAVRHCLAESKAEAVIHMSAASLVGESVHNPAKYYQQNVIAGLNLLDVMLEFAVPRLVFSSTAAVYGEPAQQPITEDCLLSPTNPYGATKLAFENALRWYEAAYGLRYVSLRYFNAAGATELFGECHQPETHLIPLLLQVVKGTKSSLQVYGNDYPTPDGTCVRDYVHVADLARAHVLALEDLSCNRIYNLGCGGDGYSVLEVVDSVRRVTHLPVSLDFVPRRVGDPPVLVASSSLIQQELNWKPKFQDLDDIIDSAWSWLQRFPSGYGF